MTTANLALKFLLELGAFAAFAYWGADAGDDGWSVVLAIAAPAIAIVVVNAVLLATLGQWEH